MCPIKLEVFAPERECGFIETICNFIAFEAANELKDPLESLGTEPSAVSKSASYASMDKSSRHQA
jgi:hypothetical protein